MSKPDSSAKRTMALGAVALLGVAAVAVDQLVLQPESGGTSAADAASVGSNAVVVVPLGAPPGADLAELRKRYRPVTLKRPFEERSFKDRPKPRPRDPAPTRRPDPRPAQPKAEEISLRLTAFLGHGEERMGLFEARGSGKAVFASKGKTVAGYTVAAVGTSSVTVVASAKEPEKQKETRRELQLGESLVLPLSARDALEPLQPDGTRKKESGPVTTKTKLPELSEDKKMSILERLKARRRRSLKKEGK